jgi:hypothetical protein
MARHTGIAGTAGVVSTAASAGWIGALILIATVLAVLTAGCWILSNTARTQRLTDVITAWRTPGATTSRQTPPAHAARRKLS